MKILKPINMEDEEFDEPPNELSETNIINYVDPSLSTCVLASMNTLRKAGHLCDCVLRVSRTRNSVTNQSCGEVVWAAFNVSPNGLLALSFRSGAVWQEMLFCRPIFERGLCFWLDTKHTSQSRAYLVT